MAQKKEKIARAQRGLGRLYKRDAQGRECPANSHKTGTFWIAWREEGKRKRQRLEIDGKPIIDLETAKKEQLRIRAPYLTGQRIEVLKSVEADIKRLEGIRDKENDEANPPLSLAEAWKYYVNASNRPENGMDTRKHYKTMWGRFVGWVAEHYPNLKYMRDVTDIIADEYMGYLRCMEWTGNTYNKNLMFLRLIYRVLGKQARTANPFMDIVRKKQIMNSRRVLSMDELHTVITTANGDLRMLFIIGTFTGMRLADCATLRWDEIDMVASIIKKKPRKTLHSSGAEITLGIPNALYDVLMDFEGERDGYVIPGIAKYFICEPQKGYWVSKMIQSHFEKCGIRTHREGTGHKYHYEGKKKVYDKSKRAIVEVGFHSLRHTWVSLHAASGTPQALIQDAAGHSNPAMTEHYTHINNETARNIANAIDLPQLLDADPQAVETEKIRQQLLRLVRKASGPALQKLLAYAENYGL